MLEGKDVTIKLTPAPDNMAKFDSDFYPGGVPDATANPTAYGIYTKSVQKVVDQEADKHSERLEYYEVNKNKIRNIALGQYDKGFWQPSSRIMTMKHISWICFGCSRKLRRLAVHVDTTHM
mmetsp:Transcript_18921/g.29239  ORF Transcript_18921/g.29239 Transcript_18921/m.29239 type:complete len:121 (-) Transcript_18921:683-1045(-)